MYLISSGSDAFYPNNTRSKFQNTLKNSIDGLGYAISVESVQLQKHFNNVTDEDIIYLRFTNPTENNLRQLQRIPHEDSNEIFHFSVSVLYIEHPECRATLKFKRGRYEMNYFCATFNQFTKKYFKSRISLLTGSNNKVKVHLEMDEDSCYSVIFMTKNIAKVLGFSNKQINDRMEKDDIDFVFFETKEIANKFVRVYDNMYCCRIFDMNTLTPENIKIYCTEVINSEQTINEYNLLAVLPGVANNDGTIYDYEPLSNMWASLNYSYINRLGLVLKDEFNNQLEFSIGSASYIKIKIKKIPQKEMFNSLITCSSNESHSKILFPNNTNNNFSISFPKEIKKGNFDHWSLTLLNASLPTSTPNITTGANIIKVYDIGSDIEGDTTTTKELNYTTEIPIGYYTSVSDIISTIEADLEKYGGIRLSLLNGGRTSLANMSIITNKMIEMPAGLAVIFGYTRPVKHYDRKIELETPINNRKISGYHANLKMTEPQFCKILCDQVSPTFFGGAEEQLLRFLPISGIIAGKSTFHDFYSKHPIEINASSLNKLDFRITYENSPDLMQFDERSVPTQLTLLINRYNKIF